MKCQMLCGRCKSDASLVLHAGGKMMHSLNLRSCEVVAHKAPKRTIYACENHRDKLKSCAELYGGKVQAIAL